MKSRFLDMLILLYSSFKSRLAPPQVLPLSCRCAIYLHHSWLLNTLKAVVKLPVTSTSPNILIKNLWRDRELLL